MDNTQQPLGVYRYSLIGGRIVLVIMGLAVFFGFFVARMVPPIILFESGATKVYLGDVISIGCAIMALVAIGKPPFIASHTNAKLVIYLDHFEMVHPELTEQVKWTDVETYTHDVVLNQNKKSIENSGAAAIYLKMRDGTNLRLDKMLYENFIEMARQFMQLLPPALAPHYIQQLQSGQTFEYSRFTVAMNGLSSKKQSIVWSQVSRLEIERNYVELMFTDNGRQERAFARLFFTEPNALVLLECIHLLAPQLPKFDVAQTVMG